MGSAQLITPQLPPIAHRARSKEQGARSSWGGSIARRRHLVSVGRHLAGSRFSSSTWVCYAKIWARKSRQRRVHRDDARKGVFHTPRDRLPSGQVFVSSLGLAYALVFNGKKREGKPQRNLEHAVGIDPDPCPMHVRLCCWEASMPVCTCPGIKIDPWLAS